MKIPSIRVILLGVAYGLWAMGTARAAEIYQFVDNEGGLHLASTQVHAGYVRVAAEAPVLPPPTTEIARPEVKPVPADRGTPLEGLIRRVAQEVGVDAALLRAVVHVESAFQSRAQSPKGALGLMQILPGTARAYGVDEPRQLLDPLLNLRVGATYLKDLLHRFDANWPLALAAYNAGPQAVERYGMRIPPYRETRAYVPRVLQLANAYRNGQHP